MAQQQALDPAQLHEVLANTLSPTETIRRNAERQLESAQQAPGHLLTLLHLVANQEIAANAAVRQAGAIHLKNIIRTSWNPDPQSQALVVPISREVRTTMKDHLVQIMLASPPQIQSQCIEAISLIAMADYHEGWPNLLPQLVQHFTSQDLGVVCAVLETASNVCKRFRDTLRNDELYAILAYTLNIIQAPLLTLVQANSHAIRLASGNVAELRPRFTVLLWICEIFYSLNWQDLPEFFEDHLDEWMNEFTNYLQYQNHILEDETEEYTPSPIDEVQVVIIDCLSHYANKDEETFIPRLPGIMPLVWNRLMQTTPLPKHDKLATTCIKFLSSLVKKQMHAVIFNNEATLSQLVDRVVIPNILIREVDEENFEDQPRVFLSEEIEGSELESRRLCCQNLLRDMCRNYEAQTTKICLDRIGTMLGDTSDPSNKWKAKFAAIHLFYGVAIRTESRQEGVSQINENVEFMKFFTENILPELQDRDHSRQPIIKATALNYVITFRNQFSKQELTTLIPLLIAHLSSPSMVVHTFAAFGIEKALVTKDPDLPGRTMKVGRAELQPHLEALFTGLFSIIDRSGLEENEWVMKCIMRCLAISSEDLAQEVTSIVLNTFIRTIDQIAKNPKNPDFNQYVFESIAVLIRAHCSRDPSVTQGFEVLLFPLFNDVLQREVLELTPYVFQILAQLLEFRPREGGLGEAYTIIFRPLLQAVLWERRGNVPALTRLLRAYLNKDPNAIVTGGHLPGILGIFQSLLASGPFLDCAFDLLKAIIQYSPAAALEPFIRIVFKLLFERYAASAQREKFAKVLSNFLGLYVGLYGSANFIERFEAGITQAGQGGQWNALQFTGRSWVKAVIDDPPRRMDAKVQVIGLTRLLCETPVLLADETKHELWAYTLSAVVTILTNPNVGIGGSEPIDVTMEVPVGYDAKFSRLSFARPPAPNDPFPDVEPKSAFLQALQGLSAQRPGVLIPLVRAALQSDLKLAAGFESMLTEAGIALS